MADPCVTIPIAISKLEQVILLQRESSRHYFYVAFSLLALGIVSMIFPYSPLGWTAIPDAQKWPMLLGGGIISSVSAAPWKELINKRVALGVLCLVKEDCAREHKLVQIIQIGDQPVLDCEKKINIVIERLLTS